MFELIHEAFSLHNLPVTLLFGAVLCYWLLVILGVADVDDGGGSAGDVDVGVDAHADAAHGGGHGGLLSSAGRFFHLGVVPFMIILSIMSLLMWTFSVLSNYYLNGEPGQRSAWMALGLLVPNVLISALITRLVLIPTRGFFARLNDGAEGGVTVAGRQGVVVSTQVDQHYGQVELHTNGAPLLVNARIREGEAVIPRAALVEFYDSGPDNVWHYVRPAAPPAS